MRLRARAGFTLLEMAIALTMVSVVVGAISVVLVGAQRELTRQRDAMKHEDTVRSVEVLLVRLLRNGRADPRSVGANVAKINLNPQARATWNNVRVRSDFNPPDGNVNGELEDVLVDHVGDTVFVRWQAVGATQRYAYPVKLFRIDAYRLDGTPVTDTTLSDLVQKVKLTIDVPKSSSTTEVVRRERWVFLRN
jgi:prepilin-type N-terminal cleavage/methylation domain-containing protein